MKPEEKAQELIEKFSIVVGAFDKTSYRYEYEKAKTCALICVEEILSVIGVWTGGFDKFSALDYWQSVKSSIESK